MNEEAAFDFVDALSTYLRVKLGVEPSGFSYAVPPELSGAVRVLYVEQDSPLPHWYFVTSGFADYGFELTLRVLRTAETQQPHRWPDRFFGDLMDYVAASGRGFTTDDYFEYTDGPLETDAKTAMTGSVFVSDDDLLEMETPAGPVLFLQVFPLFADELAEVKGDDYLQFIEQLKARVPSLIFNGSRRSVLNER